MQTRFICTEMHADFDTNIKIQSKVGDVFLFADAFAFPIVFICTEIDCRKMLNENSRE